MPLGFGGGFGTGNCPLGCFRNAFGECVCSIIGGGGGGGGNSGGDGGGGSGSVTVLPGGSTASTGLNQYLQTLLSGIALFQHQPYIPTTIQPVVPTAGVYTPEVLALLLANKSTDSTASGKVEKWIKANTGVTLMLAAGAALFLMKSPRQGR